MTSSSVSGPDSGSDASTSLSLLDRMRQREDAAWYRFVELYGPLVYRWCRQGGLAASDAGDVGQQVFLAVHQAVGEFQHRGVKGSFRAWLKMITRRKLVDQWRGGRREPSAQAVPFDEQLFATAPAAAAWPEGTPDSDDQDSEGTWLYRRASELIRVDFSETTWQAFWKTVVEGRPAKDIADELGLTLNAVYIAKSRVLTRLRTEFAGLLD